MFDRLVTPQVRNTLVTDMLSLGEDKSKAGVVRPTGFGPMRRIPDDIREALEAQNVEVPANAYFPSRVTIKGITYAIRSIHEGNSNIIIDSITKTPVPFSIVNFVTYPGGDVEGKTMGPTYAILRRYLPARVDYDPYKEFPHLRAAIWSKSLSETLEAVEYDMLETHFAKCVIPWEGREVAVVISLSKVTTHLILLNLSLIDSQTLLLTSSETQTMANTALDALNSDEGDDPSGLDGSSDIEEGSSEIEEWGSEIEEEDYSDHDMDVDDEG